MVGGRRIANLVYNAIPGEARIVYHYIQFALAKLGCSLYQVLDMLCVQHISDHRQGLSARFIDALRHIVGFFY